VKKTTIFLAAVFVGAALSAALETAGAKGLPKIIVLGSLSRSYEPVKFNHEQHLSLAENCETCHHQHKGMKVAECKECHRFDPASFKKNAMRDRLLPCRDCHMPTERPGATGQPDLKTAYHNVCNKCHWGQVNTATLEGCSEICHSPKTDRGREKKKK